jgi:hypothetical protein
MNICSILSLAFLPSPRYSLNGNQRSSAVKITVIGRPGKIDQTYQNLVVTTLINTPQVKTLPKGVPTPPPHNAAYVVYIGMKQWRKVADAINNPDDKLIVEGYCAFDAEQKAMAVFATSVTTRTLQMAKNQAKADAAEQAAAEGATEQSPAPTPAAPAPAPAAPQLSLEEAQQRLQGLYKLEDEARERLEEIKSLPPGEQLGIGTALRELQKIKADITALKQQHPKLK